MANPTLTLTASRAAWVAMLTAASRAANAKPIEIFGSVLLSPNAVGVAWWATDLEIWRGGVMEATVERPGEGLLPVAQTLAMLKSCADGMVRVVFDEKGGASVTVGAFKARIPSQAATEYAARPAAPMCDAAVPVRALARVLSDVSPAVNPQAGQYFMKGALIEAKDGRLMAVATDGHQLARSIAAVEISKAVSFSALVPFRALRELTALLKETKADEVSYEFVDDRHVFRVGADVLVSRVIDGQFPTRWDRMIPTSHTTRITCDRDLLIGSLRRVSLMRGATLSIDLAVDAAGLTLKAESQERGEAVDLVAADKTGEDVAFQMNADYILGFLETATNPEIACEAADARSPVVFRCVSPQQSDYVHVIQTMVRP